jgi:hypothetical protein
MMNCVVCLEPTESMLEECKHPLCDKCADSWYNGEDKWLLCPICRQELTEQDVDRITAMIARRCIAELSGPYHQVLTEGGPDALLRAVAISFGVYSSQMSERCTLLAPKLKGFQSVLYDRFRLTWGHTLVETNRFNDMGGKNHMLHNFKLEGAAEDEHMFVVFTKAEDGEIDFTL